MVLKIEKIAKKVIGLDINNKAIEDLKKFNIDSIFIGVAQALAIIPGVSRSGSTVSTGLILGLKKEHVIPFSFLLAVPAILGATILEYESGILTPEMIFGFFLTIIVGYITLKILIKIIMKDKFHYFGWYCLILGLIILLA